MLETINETNENINKTEVSVVKEKKKKRKKNWCNYEEIDCKEKQSLSVGLCKWCNKSFCIKHRLPEAHNCPQMKNCKLQAFEINKARMNGEKCISKKVESF